MILSPYRELKSELEGTTGPTRLGWEDVLHWSTIFVFANILV